MQDRERTEQAEPNGPHETPRRGRPKGSKNKPRFSVSTEGWDQEAIEMTQRTKVAKPRSAAFHRKWQREWIRPQFTLTRKEAYEIFFKYLRSSQVKNALKDLITQGSPGVGKLTDSALGKYLEQTCLLSRYPHEVIIKG